MTSVGGVRVRSLFATAAMAAVMGIVPSACAGDAAGPGGATIDTSSTAGDVGFSADKIGGGRFSLSEELATRPVALWFWAPG